MGVSVDVIEEVETVQQEKDDLYGYTNQTQTHVTYTKIRC